MSIPGGPPASTHVLVVEDSSLLTEAIGEVLTVHGYSVAVAHSLAAARSLAREQPPDVVLLDLELPDGSGLGLIPAWEAASRPVFLALTGFADEETRRRCLDAGCTRVLVKPVGLAELLGHIADFTD